MAYDDRELYADLYSDELKKFEEEQKEDVRKSRTVGDLEMSDSAIAALNYTEIDKAIRDKYGIYPTGASMLEMMRHHNLRDRRRRWGWHIYRTTYKSDKNWARFLKEFNEDLKGSIVERHGHDDHMRFMHWPVFEDKSVFDGASTIALRKHFLSWRESDQPWQEAGLTKENAPELVSDGAPMYDSFISVDEESLDSVLGYNGMSAKIGFVNLVQADWPPSDAWDRDAVESDDGYSAIEGITIRDVGFQRVDLNYFYPDIFNEASELERRLWYVRPPIIYPRAADYQI